MAPGGGPDLRDSMASSCTRRLQTTTTARFAYVGLGNAIKYGPTTIWHLRAIKVDPSPITSHQINRAASASTSSVAVKRNNMFRNRIYRGVPTIVLLVVAGIIEFMAIHAFV